MAELLTNTTDLTKVASAIREKGGTSDPLVYPDGFVTAIQAIQTGGGGAAGAPGDITFYDYDGTIVTSWTLEELATKTALPDYPSHEGLTCQGWNWSLADLKTTNRKMNVGAMYITDDGKTRIYIRLEEGRTSPMLGVCPNGTVTVDWGDGTTPDTLTGTSTSTVQWTPNHAYAAPGEYVIKLTVDGTMGFYGMLGANGIPGLLSFSSSNDYRNYAYLNNIKKVELGANIPIIQNFSFFNFTALELVTIPNSVTRIQASAFHYCYSLKSVVIPSSITYMMDNEFYYCQSLASVIIPSTVTSIYEQVFRSCYALSFFTIPDGVTEILDNAFNNCRALTSLAIPGGVTSIGTGAFRYAYGMAVYDFTAAISVPTLDHTNAFGNIPADCQIRVPASLVDEWKAATNWSTYADHIVGV